MELELQGRDLSRGMNGADVAALHNALFQAGYTIADKELSDKFFGNTTHAAVVDFQKKVKLVPNGIFDAKAAWLIEEDHEHPNKFIVIGQVFQANGTPLEGATVKAFDKDLRSEEQFAKTDTTKRNGEYSIFYRADEFARAEKDSADLIVRVFDSAGRMLKASTIIFNAGKVEVVNLTVGQAARGLSEFDKLVNDLAPLLEGVTQVQLTPDDIAFLNGETQIDAALLNLLVESARRHDEANTIPQFAFYGLFRQSLPTVLTELLQNEIELLRAALDTSSNQGIIAQLPATELDQIAEQLRILKASLLLQPGAPGQTSSLGDLLRTSNLTAAKQRIVAELYIQHGGTTDPFWEAINQRTDFTAADKNDVRFTLQVGALTTNHIPLVVELRSTAPAGLIVEPRQSAPVASTALSEDATALRPFVVKDVAGWKTTLQKAQPNGQPIGAPPSIPGATPQEKIDNYAVALNAYMEKALPTPVVAARVEQDTAGDNPFNPVRADLRTFFTNNPLYEFKKTPIDAYLSEGRDEKLRGVTNPTALIAELKNMQRLFNIAPRYAEMRSLCKDDVHSALSMVKLGQRRFTEKYAAVLGGPEKAVEAYRKAQHRHATALNFYLNNALASNLPSPSVVGNGAMKAPAKTLAAASATPDLPSLFGSLDLCDCSQCQSLYSPAAYFVDILRFLGEGPFKNNRTPLEVLFSRRPDLEHIELTCENTTTPLPYVDLAREILERAVSKREFSIAEGTDINDVLADLDRETIRESLGTAFSAKGYPLTANASVRNDFVEGQPRAWLILDSGWAFRLQYLGTGQGFRGEAWPQTSWTADELRANPEHVHEDAYTKLRDAVYPWDLPLNRPVEEARVYLGHFGVKRQQVMETFFRGPSPAALTDQTIANEYLGLTKQEADIITGNTSSKNAWDFWGLKQTGNHLVDPSDGTAPDALGDWDVVLQRVSIFLQQSALSYRDMLELLGSYFINPAAGSTRTLGIISTVPGDPATCNLSRLQIQVIDPNIPDADKRAALIAALNRMHRFARLWRKLGWTMRDLDKAIVALQPKNTAGNLDLTPDFLVQLSHLQRLRAQFGLPVVNLLSFWAPIDTGRYFDQFAEGAPPVPTLYAQLFNNKSAAGQSLVEDPSKLTGNLSNNAAIIAAALQVTIDDLNLLIADPNVVPEDNLTLANLSRLYRHATFAKALKYSTRNYLSALKLISATPFATTEETIRFTQHTEKIVASGFSLEDLNYLLRHDFSATSNIAIADNAIAVVLSSIRAEVRKITTENEGSTNDPDGDLTQRKRALLVVQRLGEFLQLDTKAANDLLTTWARSPVHPAQTAISEFLAASFAESSADVEVSRDTFPDQFETFLLLHKIAVLGLKFRLTAEQMRWLFEFGPDNGWLDLNALPLSTTGAAHSSYQRWARLADLFELRDALPVRETLLSDIFTSARDTGTQLSVLLDKLSKGSGWKLENVAALSSAFSFEVSAYKDEVALQRLRAAFALLNQLGASAEQCLFWTERNPPANRDPEQECARDVKSLVRARLDNSQWLEIARVLNDPLREKQRAALVSYLTQTLGARNANELYDDFLVDVEMSPCMMTTRIKQAIASVQLFIQRSLMNLEADVSLTPQEAREWAQWRKQYRIWEANRKVLLYPENWIEPELRDGKSSFFQDLENELLQADVTMDTAETAFLNYLEKLQEVARLEIVGMYREREIVNFTPTLDVLHVIGRTFSEPHVYYYRKQINSAWTPWEKVEADIQGDHLIPLVWNRRLFVFWPMFSIKQRETKITLPAEGQSIPSGDKTIEVKLAWTEYKNGKWSAKKLSTPFLSELRHPEMSINKIDFNRFSFKSRVQNSPLGEQQLFIDCYGPVETITTITVPGTGANPVQETPLFTITSSTQRKKVLATVNGGAFQAADVNKVEIVGRDAQTAEEVSRTRLTATGTLTIDHSEEMGSVKYYLSSADFRVENLQNRTAEQFCYYTSEASFTGGNGDAPARALAAGVDAVVSPALVPIGGGAPHLLEANTGPVRVCTTISRCEFNLVTVPPPTTTRTDSFPSVDPMKAIASFHFDDAQQSVAPLFGSTEISNLQPILGTRFENMMMVEEYDNPNNDGLGESRMLQATPGIFRLLGMHQSYLPKALAVPIFFQDDARTYFVVAVAGTAKVRFNTFFHPTVRSFFKALNRTGINGLLTLPNQLVIDQPPAFDVYQPKDTRVDLNAKPREDVDFSYNGAYSIYNWELFFHAPFLIATQLSQNQRFEEAQKWFHYIFDPTATDSPERPGNPGAERFWRVKPLYNEALQGARTLEELFADAETLEAQVKEWQANPFKPHVIARLRLVTYMKAVVMRYLDNLIAWGDQLFRRDTIESINEATQLYILAAQILGRRPEQIPARAKAKVQTFRTLDDEAAFNSLANAAVEIEAFLPPSTEPLSTGDSEDEGAGGLPLMPFFGIPGNEKLLGYWTTVADRLFKIRHCQNIEGVVRSLPVFEPPIDPGLLVKAAAVGVDVTNALSDINVALPHYRFNVMLQKASDLCAEVKALGSALLSALEKRDAEALALLRSTHELKVMQAVRTIKQKQIEDAVETRAGLERAKELTTLRRDYYRDIAFMNPWETTQLALAGTSLGLQATEVAMFALAGALHLIPNVKVGAPTSLGMTVGGQDLGDSGAKFGESIGKVVSLLNTSAAMAATMGGHQRRFDDWKLQERLAEKELEQIERQIAGADIRIAIAEKDLSNHDLQVENAREVDEFMRSKFTNRELYDWMVGQISGIYFQSYQLAYDVAKRAERAFRYELGLRESNFIQFGYWDSLKKGLLAGERLSYDLKRMDVAYLDQNKREYEIVKHVSLMSIDPVSLVKLKETGECFVTLPEALFDVDYSGHYMRRIKSVGITVPAVAGPYSGVNCTLTLQSSTIRYANTLANGKYGRQADDPRFVDSVGTVQSIVTSGAQNDSGLFETNLRDERYLPFEGQGAISTWRIEMPKNFKSFDYNTISDVVLHVRYTAREGGVQLKAQAEQELQTALNDFVRVEGARGLAQMFSLRHDFSTEWSRFLNAPDGVVQSLTAAITTERFPFLFRGRNLSVKAIDVYVKVKPEFADHNKDTIKIALAAGTSAPAPPNGETLTLDLWNGLVRGSKDLNNAPGVFALNAWRNNGEHLDPNAIQDIVIVCRYTVSN